jgi:hypothetical protein
MTILDSSTSEVTHESGDTQDLDVAVETLRGTHLNDIDALKQIVIGLTARVNELEFTARHGGLYQPGLFFRNEAK